MDKKKYDEIEELIDEEIDESSSYENIESDSTSDFNNQNLNTQIRNIRRSNKRNQNTISRLNQRKANTMNKGVESKKSTLSNFGNSENDKPEDDNNSNNVVQNVKNNAKQAGKEVVHQVKEQAKQAAKQAVKKVAAKIVTHPYFWVFMGALILIILIPVLWAAYDEGGDGDTGGGNSGITYVAGYESCKSITVTGKGTYPLETYIAGVVEHEAYKDESMEALKAQAIAARTYVIYKTNNCQNAIAASEGLQTFSTNPSAISIQAANESAGQVLTYKGKIFESNYDSFCYDDPRCPDAVRNSDGTYTVTYIKRPNGEKHKITLSQKKQYSRIPYYGHGMGMSQLYSYQLASQGKKYDEILKFFYSSGVEISSITKVNASSILGDFNGEFTIRKVKPNWLSQPDSKYYLKQGSNNFQCVWYAKYRMNEIISTIKGAVDEKKREEAKNTLLASSAHGSGWYNLAQNGGSMSKFESSNDYMKPRPGALVSYRWTNSHWENNPTYPKSAGHDNYGHVAVVESVDYENQTVVVTEGWRVCGYWNNRECLGFKNRTLTFEQMKNFGQNHYEFLGYVYVADYTLNSTIGTTANSDISINADNSGSTSNGKANTCSLGKVDKSQPDPSIAVNYWAQKGLIKASDYIYPTDKATNFPLGAHPKNFKYSNLTNTQLYQNTLIIPVTPANGQYIAGYRHNGIDITATFGTPIYSPGDGRLLYSEWGNTVNKGCDETAYSVTVILDKPFMFEGKKVKSLYLTHMAGIVYYCPRSNCNRTVKKGELLGFIGTASGSATDGDWAPHLHMSFYDDVYNAGFGTSQIESIYNLYSGKKIVAGG